MLELLEKEGDLEAKIVTVLANCGSSVIKGLVEKGYVELINSRVCRNIFDEEVVESSPLELSKEQQTAMDLFEKMQNNQTKSKVLLLFGATNTGKTEVYLQAISAALTQGKSAIVLVPEIALTAQTIRRFRSRFGNEISVLHSRLTEAERFDQWHRIIRGEVNIVIGARSALFPPLQNLGLIVVDEEHEGSYKQMESPRYHARDVAVVRAKMEDACVILGSATPSFESYTNALNGRYEMAKMSLPANQTIPPQWVVVNMKLTQQAEMNERSKNSEDEVKTVTPLFSPMLKNAISARLERGEQVVLFMNRRGFAKQMLCEDCGYVAQCSDCSISYTYHKKEQLLRCHMCGGEVVAPQVCPQCQSGGIRYEGTGTEKIEGLTRALFPQARVGRMDSDTMRGVDAHSKILNKLQRREIDILIGTQMIAKGLHFPNITLVGVINADQGLYIPDFRSAERTFQLLTQVAGRSGRGDRAGEVLIQTFNPEHEAIDFAVKGQFQEFYEYDAPVRELLMFPPFGHIIALHFRSEDEELCAKCAMECFEKLKPFNKDEMIIVEPLPSAIGRIKGKFRYQILFRGKKLKNFRKRVRELALQKHYKGRVDVYVDADPTFLA